MCFNIGFPKLENIVAILGTGNKRPKHIIQENSYYNNINRKVK